MVRGEGVGPAGTTATAAATTEASPIAAAGAPRAVPDRATRRTGTRELPCRNARLARAECRHTADRPDPGGQGDPRPHGAARAPLHQRSPGAGDRRETRNRRRPPRRDGEPAEPETGEYGRHQRGARRHRDHNRPRPGHLDTRPHVRRQLRHRSGHDASTPHFVRGGRPAPDQRHRVAAEQHRAPIGPPPRQHHRGGRHRGEPRRQRDPGPGAGRCGLGHRGILTRPAISVTGRLGGALAHQRQWAISVPLPSTAVEHRSTGPPSDDRQGPARPGGGGATLVQRDRRPEHRRGGPVRLPRPRGTAAACREARAVRRRRAERPGQALGRGAGPVGADVPRRLRGRPAQPGHPDPLRDPQRAAGRAGRALLRGVAGPRGADARGARARVHRRRAPSAGRLRRARASASPPSSATRTCSPRWTWPGSRCTPPTATSTTRSSSPVGTRRSTRSRSPTSSTSRRSATARRSSATSPTSCATGRPPGRPGGRRELLLRLAEVQGCYVPSLYARLLRPGRRDRRGAARRARASRARCRSAPPWTSTRGPTRRRRWCRWPRPCTSARASRSSAAAPGAAASARPA